MKRSSYTLDHAHGQTQSTGKKQRTNPNLLAVLQHWQCQEGQPCWQQASAPSGTHHSCCSGVCFSAACSIFPCMMSWFLMYWFSSLLLPLCSLLLSSWAICCTRAFGNTWSTYCWFCQMQWYKYLSIPLSLCTLCQYWPCYSSSCQSPSQTVAEM